LSFFYHRRTAISHNIETAAVALNLSDPGSDYKMRVFLVLVLVSLLMRSVVGMMEEQNNKSQWNLTDQFLYTQHTNPPTNFIIRHIFSVNLLF
jgi:hypothetical protein